MLEQGLALDKGKGHLQYQGLKKKSSSENWVVYQIQLSFTFHTYGFGHQ
jgi:hypothetical protein